MYKYLVKADLRYRKFELKVKTYKEAKEKYAIMKEIFNDVPCSFHLINLETEKEVWAPSKKTVDMRESWNRIIDAICDFEENYVETCQKQSEFDKTTDMRHKIEDLELIDMSEEDMANWLTFEKMKIHARRINKDERTRYALMQKMMNEMLDVIKQNYKYINLNNTSNKAGLYAHKKKYKVEDIEKFYL